MNCLMKPSDKQDLNNQKLEILEWARKKDLLGKPKGTLQKSKFDADLERIKELLKLGLSVRKIATLLGYNSHLALNTSINKRKLREQGS